MPGTAIFLVTAVLAAVVGWYQLFLFSSTPGQQLAAPAQLPAQLSADWPAPALSQFPLLLVFIHPQCSCTHATLDQLDRILDHPGNATPVRIVLAVYQSRKLDRSPVLAEFKPATWLHQPFHLMADTDGALARRFGAATSGEIVLYAADGRLLFQGGITPERAQAGDSATADALRNALLKGTPQSGRARVFGCPIFHLQRAG